MKMDSFPVTVVYSVDKEEQITLYVTHSGSCTFKLVSYQSANNGGNVLCMNLREMLWFTCYVNPNAGIYESIESSIDYDTKTICYRKINDPMNTTVLYLSFSSWEKLANIIGGIRVDRELHLKYSKFHKSSKRVKMLFLAHLINVCAINKYEVLLKEHCKTCYEHKKCENISCSNEAKLKLAMEAISSITDYQIEKIMHVNNLGNLAMTKSVILKGLEQQYAEVIIRRIWRYYSYTTAMIDRCQVCSTLTFCKT